MNKNKPDALLVLAIIFGLGVLVSALTHGDSPEPQVSALGAVCHDKVERLVPECQWQHLYFLETIGNADQSWSTWPCAEIGEQPVIETSPHSQPIAMAIKRHQRYQQQVQAP